jgi:hypothetical protein
MELVAARLDQQSQQLEQQSQLLAELHQQLQHEGLKHLIASQVRMQQLHTLEAAISAAMAADSIAFVAGAAGFGPYGSSSGGGSFRGAAPRGNRPFGGSSFGDGSSGRNNHPAPMELGSLRQQQQQQRGAAKQEQPHPPSADSGVPYCSWHKCTGHHTRDCRKRASALRFQHPGGSTGR